MGCFTVPGIGKDQYTATLASSLAGGVFFGTQFTCFTGTKVQILTQKALQAFANLLSKRANSSTKCSGPPPRRSQIQKTSSLGHIYRSM